MPTFRPGVDLARDYYTQVVRPLLGDLPHAAARIGPGSDVLGFDGPRSTDHDWGPRLEIFVDDPTPDLTPLRHRLPRTFQGWPTHFTPPTGIRVMTPTDGPVDHYLTITAFPRWCHTLLGFHPTGPPTTHDWLATPWQRLAEITGGAVFHDPTGALTHTRELLRWYPDDLWRYVLACQWRRIAQEEAFPARAHEAGDDLGSRLITARLCREIARLLLLLSRRWPPYSKWLTHAAAADPTTAHLRTALRTDDPATRLDALCTALEETAARQNQLTLAAAPPATRRSFHDRGYAVLDADRYATALMEAVTDPAIRALPLTGCADQLLDSTDALTDPRLTRAALRSASACSPAATAPPP